MACEVYAIHFSVDDTVTTAAWGTGKLPIRQFTSIVI